MAEPLTETCQSCGQHRAATRLELNICVVCAGLVPEPEQEALFTAPETTPGQLVLNDDDPLARAADDERRSSDLHGQDSP